MPNFNTCAAVLGLVVLTGAGAANAQPHGPPPPASHDPATAPAGTYRLDSRHTSVIARVGHMNTISYSTFRFGGVSGTLEWGGSRPEASKVDIEIQMNSIETPVQGFSAELQSPGFLNAAQYPTAHFVSTAITRIGADSGVIAGQLTFMGQTRPIEIKASFIGAGRTMMGAPAIGFSGKAVVKRSAFGYTAMIPVISDDIDLVIDTEFDKAP